MNKNINRDLKNTARFETNEIKRCIHFSPPKADERV